MPYCVKLRLAPAILSVLSLLYSTHHLLADDNSARISVVPFEYSLGVLKDDAETLQNLFESALIETKQFTVVKQSDIATILEAQEASLQDFTDRESAVRLGRIISANHIFMGSVAKLGRTYIVSLQLVDVERGKAVKAEIAEATAIESFVHAMGRLADSFTGRGGREIEGESHKSSQSLQSLDYRIRMYLTIGDRFTSLRRYDSAVSYYERALALDEFNVDILWRIVTARKEQLLINSLYRRDAINTGEDIALRDDFGAYRIVPVKAIEDILAGIYTIQAIDPLLLDDLSLMLDEAEILKLDGRINESITILENAYRIYPDNPFVLAEFGLLLVLVAADADQDLNSTSETGSDPAQRGLDFIRRSVSLSPGTPLFHLYLGRSLERVFGHLNAEAIRSYREAAELSDGQDFWIKRIGDFAGQSIQRIYYRLGATDNGVLSEELAMSPAERLDHLEYILSRGILFRSKTAVQHPDLYLAELYFALGQFEQAEAAARRLLGDDPDRWSRSQLASLKLFEKILSRTGTDRTLAEELRKKIEGFD